MRLVEAIDFETDNYSVRSFLLRSGMSICLTLNAVHFELPSEIFLALREQGYTVYFQ